MRRRKGQLRVGAAAAIAAALLVSGLGALRAGWSGEAGPATRPATQPATRPATAPAQARAAIPASPDQIPVTSFIAFSEPAGTRLHLDIASPPSGAGPFPAVVCIHGGAWELGHRCTMLRTVKYLAYHGYVAVTVDYRLSPDHKFPAPVEDVKCAVRFLRASAAKYNIDPNRIAAMGESAGAHLALLVGLTGSEDGMEGAGYQNYSSRVQAVVNYFGPADLKNWHISPLADMFLQRKYGRRSEAIINDFLGTKDPSSPVFAWASPISYVDSADPPVLTFHGLLDVLVPPSQSANLHEKLKAAGVPEKLVAVPLASHGWGGAERDRTDAQMLEFLDEHLKGIKPPSADPPASASR